MSARPLLMAAALLLTGTSGPVQAKAPAMEVVPWKPAGISSPMFESHPAFDPLTGELYFVRSSPSFEGWRILVSRCERAGWSAPVPPVFAGDGVEADPYFADAGRTLYFISTRTTDGVKRKDLDIWSVQRDGQGRWGTPQRLPQPVNSTAPEWFPRPARDGWLYFGSGRPGGMGKTDLWRARIDARQGWRVENLGAAVNTPEDEYEPLPSADGQRMIFMAADGLYQARATADGGWAQRVKLGPPVFVNGTEIGALFSPSGRSLLFARDTHEPDSGEFFVMREAGAEISDAQWPPACPAARPDPRSADPQGKTRQ